MVCVADGEVIDRQRIELLEPGLPNLPHHHECQGLPADEAEALVERVRASAGACAREALEALPSAVRAIAIRARPALPPTVAERVASYWAQTRADGVMYRDVLAEAAEARGWQVIEYDPKTVFEEAAAALRVDDITPRLQAIGKALGSPWQKDHRMAAAAAMAALV